MGKPLLENQWPAWDWLTDSLPWLAVQPNFIGRSNLSSQESDMCVFAAESTCSAGPTGGGSCWGDIMVITILLLELAFLATLASYATSIFKRWLPNVSGLVGSVLTWKPILWGLIFFLGFEQPYPVPEIHDYLLYHWDTNPHFLWFIILAVFKFFKIIVHTISYYGFTRPILPLKYPTYKSSDVTVIIPTVGDLDDEFQECIHSILDNNPARIIIATVGEERLKAAKQIVSEIGSPKLHVVVAEKANKRVQTVRALKEAETRIIAFADDHVFWPRTFLRSALAPFEDHAVGLVGTVKRVRRERDGTIFESFLNYIACIYLERHNFECTATYNIDGGVFVISGRTSLVRASIVQSLIYQREFLSEYWLFSIWKRCGPLSCSDDNFITRYIVNHGYKTVFLNHPDAMIETTLGTVTAGGWEKFSGQLIRWVRTTWRSNPTSLFIDRACYKAHPWTTYAMFLSSLVNFAAIYDPLLIWLLYQSGKGHICGLLFCLVTSKLVKPLPHLMREPRDWIYFPFGVLFGYYHSWFKLKAMLTTTSISWTGRKL